jgi:hypothetical protein
MLEMKIHKAAAVLRQATAANRLIRVARCISTLVQHIWHDDTTWSADIVRIESKVRVDISCLTTQPFLYVVGTGRLLDEATINHVPLYRDTT